MTSFAQILPATAGTRDKPVGEGAIRFHIYDSNLNALFDDMLTHDDERTLTPQNPFQRPQPDRHRVFVVLPRDGEVYITPVM